MGTEYPPWHVENNVRVNCKDCTAECCKHVAIHIDSPKTWHDFQILSDYLQHAEVTTYKDNDGDWLVEWKSRCGQLEGNRCLAFKGNKQPMTCREYDVKTCVMNQSDDYWTAFFENPEDIAAYARKKGILKPVRTKLKKKCRTICCNHLAIPIDDPEEWRDFDDIKWYIAHKDVIVYKEQDWFVEFKAPLKERCMTCDKQSCEKDVQDYEVLFTTWEEVEEYCRNISITQPMPEGKKALTLTSF